MDAQQGHGDAAGPAAGAWAMRPHPARSRSDHEIAPLLMGFDPQPTAPGLARRALAPLGDHLGWEAMENVRLLVTELVTNSVLHAGDVRDPIEVEAHLFHDELVVCVCDRGPGFDPAVLAGSRAGEPGGRGLELVALLADALGIDSRMPFRVWFAIGR